MKLTNYTRRYTKIRFDNRFTSDIAVLQTAFDAIGKKVEAICTIGLMWCFVLTDDGCLWLNDKSHGGGGEYNMTTNYRFLYSAPNVPTIQEFWNKFIELNFGSADEDEVLQFLIDMEDNADRIVPAVYRDTKVLCEGFLEYMEYKRKEEKRRALW
jgi:hypothetical protein